MCCSCCKGANNCYACIHKHELTRQHMLATQCSDMTAVHALESQAPDNISRAMQLHVSNGSAHAKAVLERCCCGIAHGMTPCPCADSLLPCWATRCLVSTYLSCANCRLEPCPSTTLHLPVSCCWHDHRAHKQLGCLPQLAPQRPLLQR